MQVANNNESEIVKLLSAPETQRKGFEMAVHQYGEQLYWQVRRIVLTHDDANDVMQNVFVKAWTHLDTFRNASRLSTWLYRIAVNESLDFMRRKKGMADICVDEEAGIANMLVADKYFDGDETEAQLQEVIASLPDVQRTVFNFRYYENMKYSEISKVLNTTEGALKASYHIAVKKISDYFKSRD